jgi:hypothetical protein
VAQAGSSTSSVEDYLAELTRRLQTRPGQRARTLAGVAPAALLPQPPRSLALSALRESLSWCCGQDGAEAVLAACRAPRMDGRDVSSRRNPAGSRRA